MELSNVIPSISGLTLLLVGILATSAYLYWKRFRGNHYWKNNNVPCDDPLPLIGSLYSFLKGQSLYETDLSDYKKHGRIFGIYTGHTPMLFVGEPELLRKIMVKDFHSFADRREIPAANEVVSNFLTVLAGEDWHRVRSVVTPAFSTGKLKKMIKLIMDCGETVRNNFEQYVDSGLPLDCKRLYGGYTLDVIASAAFGTKLNSNEDPDNIFVQNVKKLFTRGFSWRVVIFFAAPWLIKLFRINVFGDDVTAFFADLSRSIVERRKKNNEVRDDFLNNLIEAQMNSSEETDKNKDGKDKDSLHTALDEDEEAGDEAENSLYFKNYSKKKSISELELVAQCVIFFLAGYDTTATTLSMVTYYMALNPECQEKMIKEIDSVWKKHETIDADALREMKYTDAVISETLRLAPPAPRLERRTVKEYQLGDTGIVIPEGMMVGFPIYAMHRDPEFFPDPEVFDPDRFLPENKDLIQPYTYMPFGTGPRNCIGMRLALMEIKLGLLQVYKDFTFSKCPETKIPLDLIKGSGLFSPKEVTVKVHRRQK